MTAPSFSSRGKIALIFSLAIIICVFVVAAHGMEIPFSSDLIDIPTPTHAPFYSMVELAKPAYTSTPTATLPPVQPSATVESLVSVETIPDAPLPDGGVLQNDGALSAASAYTGNKYILVDISEQHMYVYEREVLAYSFVASTGMNNGTRIGSFSVLDKIPNAYGATWDLWMPNWLGIYWSGSLENGIHALPILSSGAQLWAGYLGTPISFGCIVLGVDEAQTLYDWVDVGTPVEIQW